MRILLVEGSGRGFLNQYTHALSLGLHQAGHEVRLLTGARDELADWAIPFDKRACLKKGLLSWWCLRRQVRAFQPDVIHLQWVDSPLAALFFVRWAQAKGIRVVYTPHNILPHERRWRSLPLFQALYHQVDRVVVRDRHLGWALEEILDTPQERLAYLPGSPNPLSFLKPPSLSLSELSKQKSPGEFRVLFFGHGCSRKGLQGLLEVLLSRNWPGSMRMVIAGEGVLAGVSETYLKEVQARLPVSILNRYLRPEEVADLFSTTDVLLMPYRKLCKSPLTDLAAAFRVPVLRSNRVQGAGFRDGVHGMTYPYEQPDRLAGMLHSFASDPEASLSSLRYALKHEKSAEKALQQLSLGHEKLYEELLTADYPIAGGVVASAVSPSSQLE